MSDSHEPLLLEESETYNSLKGPLDIFTSEIKYLDELLNLEPKDEQAPTTNISSL